MKNEKLEKRITKYLTTNHLTYPQLSKMMGIDASTLLKKRSGKSNWQEGELDLLESIIADAQDDQPTTNQVGVTVDGAVFAPWRWKDFTKGVLFRKTSREKYAERVTDVLDDDED